jgi:hypothetical protein
MPSIPPQGLVFEHDHTAADKLPERVTPTNAARHPSRPQQDKVRASAIALQAACFRNLVLQVAHPPNPVTHFDSSERACVQGGRGCQDC